jgi:cell division inhibitor SepF
VEKVEKPEPKFEPAPKKSLFSRKDGLFGRKKAEEEVEEVAVKEEPVEEEAPKKAAPFFARKNVEKAVEPVGNGKTISMPIADKQVRVVVIEPTTFDDSQKIADYLRGNQPVVVNFENTDNIVTKRMTDFISGTIYALGGSMKKIGRSILVCAPRNVDIDAGISIYNEKGEQPWKN